MPTRFNYKFQEVDSRDYKYQITKKNNSSNSYSLIFNKIYDQGNLGSCVSNAMANLINYYNNNINPSRLYIYFNGRVLSSLDIIDDTGLTIRDGCKSISQYSVCNENIWPYNITQFSTMPNLKSYTSSINFKNFIYLSVNQDVSSIKNCILNNNPIIFGFYVYSSFLSQKVAQTGQVPYPNIQTETLEGGHCMLICGFDNINKVFKCVNSWGTSWGNNGFCFMPYNYITNSSLASDFWTINFKNISKNLNNKKIVNVNLLKKLYRFN